MSSYKKSLRNQNKDKEINDEALLGDLWYVYYNNRDLKLLLELLVCTSGIAPAISILCVFDKVNNKYRVPQKDQKLTRRGQF